MELLKQLLSEAKTKASKMPKAHKAKKFIGAVKYPSYVAGNMFLNQTCSGETEDGDDDSVSEAVNGDKVNSKPRNKHLNDILASKRNERHKDINDYDRSKDKQLLHKELIKASKSVD